MDELPEEVKRLCELHCKLVTHDLFDGPETIRTREFMKLMRGQKTSSIEDIRKELDEWRKKREEILNGYPELRMPKGSSVREDELEGQS
jgi:hypothetical protein